MSEMVYRPSEPRGRPVDSDPYFTLMADADGVGFVHCGDGVVVVPLTDGGQVLLALERSPAFDGEILVLAGGEVEEGEPLEETANRLEADNLAQEMFLSEAGRNTDDNLYFIRDWALEAMDST